MFVHNRKVEWSRRERSDIDGKAARLAESEAGVERINTWALAQFVAIHYMYYNFARIHQSLRVTPAMEAGISDHVWSLEEIIALLPE
jgi:hypothetical protein